MQKIKHILAMLVLLAVSAFTVPALAGSAAGDTTCVPTPAYTETVVVTPAVAAVPEIPAVPAVPPVTQTIAAVDEIWEVWSPNDTKGPQDYTPVWPEDERGTWQEAAEDIPPGHEGPDGVYQQGSENGNSNYFYRRNGVPEQIIVISEGTPEVPAVPGTPAVPEVTKTIDHPAVVCETPSVDPVVPETPEVPEPEEEAPVAVPNEEDDPVISTHTESSPGKTVKTHTHESGRVTKSVKHYPSDAVEEGL